MSELVVRLTDDSYVLWSDTVDAPVSAVMPRTELVAFLEHERQMAWEGAEAMAVMADQTGTSDPLRGLSDILANNRAGPGESTLTLAQLISAYSS